MTVEEVFKGVPLRVPLPAALVGHCVEGLDYDSRRVGPNFLFFAFSGQHADGARFAGDALARGALAVVSESPAPERFSGNWIQVPHGRQALAITARNFLGKPDERIALTGITGTNGKTTVSYIVDSILRAAGITTALIGTIEYRLGGQTLKAVNTTPESLDLLRSFVQLEQIRGTHATLEVSSHALELGRVHGLRFHTAVFTNLSRDHLDFHRTLEEYFSAKTRLFEGAGGPPPTFAVLNADDAWSRKITTPHQAQVLQYGLGSRASVRATHISSTMNGLRFDVQSGKVRFPVESSLVGRINVYNILAACCAALSYGLPPEVISKGVSACTAVPGRFERVEEGQPFTVVVDYAHTDDALRNTIAVARGLGPKRVITLFGCGGDRDRTKRPLMGQAAGELSDSVVLTSDNPRTEDPLAIINDALVGLRRTDVLHKIEPDRALAIRMAIAEARPGDLVILAGKGHETYQDLGDHRINFDDRQVAREALRRLGFRKEPS